MTDALSGMEIKDWITSAAVVLGPILAVQAQKVVEKIRDKRERLLRIFKSLMTTRAERVSREHVQALNMIYVDFYGSKFWRFKWQNSKDASVTNAWKIYNAHLNDKSYGSIDAWAKHGDDLFTTFLGNQGSKLRIYYWKSKVICACWQPPPLASY